MKDNSKKIKDVSLCDIDGLVDVSKCTSTPIVHSNPHFLNASPVLQNHINGLQPDPLKHKSYIDIDPETNVVLNYKLSIQLNVFVETSCLLK